MVLPDAVRAPPKDPGACDRAFQAFSEVRGLILEGRPLPTKLCAEDASSAPPCRDPWELGRHQQTPEQRHAVPGMGPGHEPESCRPGVVGGQGLVPAAWLRHFTVVRLSDCQGYLAAIGREDRTKLHNLIPDSEVGTRWPMLT